jgi:glutamate synthase (NADPH/NADH) large chain
MFLIDLEAGRIIDDKELKTPTPTPSPTRHGSTRCASSSTIKLSESQLANRAKDSAAGEAVPSLLDRQQAFGYTQEDLKFLMAPMATPVKKPSARWAMTRRWPSCPTSSSRCTTTSSSCSPR